MQYFLSHAHYSVAPHKSTWVYNCAAVTLFVSRPCLVYTLYTLFYQDNLPQYNTALYDFAKNTGRRPRSGLGTWIEPT